MGVVKVVLKEILVFVICGSVGEGLEVVYEVGISVVFLFIVKLVILENILKEILNNLRRIVWNVVVVWKGWVEW